LVFNDVPDHRFVAPVVSGVIKAFAKDVGEVFVKIMDETGPLAALVGSSGELQAQLEKLLTEIVQSDLNALGQLKIRQKIL